MELPIFLLEIMVADGRNLWGKMPKDCFAICLSKSIMSNQSSVEYALLAVACGA